MSTPYTYFQTFQVNLSIPANAPAGSQLVANIVLDPVTGTSATTVVIPPTQQFLIVDVFIRQSGDITVDAQATFVKNSVLILTTTDPLSSLLVSNPSRPKITPLFYGANDRLSIRATTLVAQGTAASSDYFYFKAQITDFSILRS